MTDLSGARALVLLQALSSEIEKASDFEAAAKAVVRAGREVLGGLSSVLWLVDVEGALDLVASDGVPDEFLSKWRRVLATDDLPAMHAVRRGEALWVGTAERYRDVDQDIAKRAREANRPMAFAALPLRFEQRDLGVLVFGFAEPHPFTDEEKALALAVAGHAAQALERARLLAAQQRVLAGLRVVAKVGEMLSTASLDIDATLTALARAVVPDVADWCAVDLFSEGNVRRLTAHHTDPAKVALAREYAERFPSKLEDPKSSLAQIMATGQTIWVRRITREMLVGAIEDEDQLEILLSLGLRSTVQVPLVSEGLVRGVVSFIMSDSGREYDETDRDLLIEVGRRAGRAVTNASLYAREQRARDRVTRLATVTAQLARASTTADVGEVACREGAVALGASGAALYALESDRLRLLARFSDSGARADGYAEIPLTSDVPITRVIHTKAPVVIESQEELRREFPALAERFISERPEMAIMCKPLEDRGGRLVGALAFSFAGARKFADDERAFARTLADHCAEAFDRARILDLANEANRVKDEFLATVSHELRTPLNAILGWAHLLDAQRLDDRAFVTRGLDVIRRNAHAQREIIEDILDVGRIISGKLRLDVAPIDIAVIIRDAIDVVRPAADAKGIRIEVSGLSDPVPYVGDRARLQQVVWNLLSNAVKFTKQGGTLNVEVGVREAAIAIRVRDDGVGIAPDLLPFVFDRFRQGDSSTTRTHGGLGLGLSIVRHLVELHGGTVSATSGGKGAGAEFEVVLPSGWPRPEAAAPVATAAASSRDATALSLQASRILVVDDAVDSSELVALALEAVGAQVRRAASADEAIELFERETFDVVLSDIAMPNVDGYALLGMLQERAAELRRPLRAVALTAHGRPGDRENAMNAGFAAYLAKPIDPREIIAVVSSLLEAS